jgi:MerR family transcriptional regulator, mercuric resistance operon regulatory protein
MLRRCGALAVAKLSLVESKLVDLARLRDVLQGLVAACDQTHGSICPIIEQLETEHAVSVLGDAR